MENLKSKAEERALKATELETFKNINLSSVKSLLTKMLDEIGRNKMFSEYTIHNISHVNGMLNLIDHIIPERVAEKMTSTDWMMIVLSFYFHDLGMLITEDEYKNRNNNKAFTRYLTTVDLQKYKSEDEEDRNRVIYQDYVRERHGDRISDWLNSIAPCGEDQPVQKMLYDMLHSLKKEVLRDLALICHSHQFDLNERIDEFETDCQYEQDAQSKYNKLYVAAILRTADLLHINSERTPQEKFLLISPQNSYSRREWVQQKSINCIRPRKEINKDGRVDDNIEQHSFEIIGEFTDEDAFSHFQSYLDYAQGELTKVYRICKESHRKNNDIYEFPWDDIDKSKIKTQGFSAEKFRFELDKDNILKLLIGHTLYNQANVVLRELTQNALDAVRLMYSSNKEGQESPAKIIIKWDSKERVLEVSDNGTGMNQDIILKYLFRVGSSMYQSKVFIDEHPEFHSISHFGIGMLTCFMISDEIDITTLHHKEKFAHLIKVRNLDGSFYMRNDIKPDSVLGGEHGTTFRLKVRESAVLKDIEDDLRRWIVIPEATVTLVNDGNETTIGYKSEIEALDSYLNTSGIKVDDKKYKYQNITIGCCTLLTLLKKDELYQSWHIATMSDIHTNATSPIGTYIEGILVENATPGLRSRVFVSVLNCKGIGSPSTNVARDRLEESEELNTALKTVYETYLSNIREQIKVIETSFNTSWSLYYATSDLDKLAFFHRDQDTLMNRNLFDECLKEEDIMLVDDGKEWKLTSINQLPDRIWTIESQAHSSAFNLVQEIKDCKKTPFALTTELHNKQYIDVDLVLAETQGENYIKALFCKNYQIKEIRFDYDSREFLFCWEKDADPWLVVNTYRRSRGYRADCVFIQKTNADVVFCAKNDENFVVSNNNMFLIGKNSITDYLNKLSLLSETDGQVAFRTVVTCVSFYLTRNTSDLDKYIENFFSSDENYLKKEIWNYIDKQELIDALAGTEIHKVDFEKYYQSREDYY